MECIWALVWTLPAVSVGTGKCGREGGVGGGGGQQTIKLLRYSCAPRDASTQEGRGVGRRDVRARGRVGRESQLGGREGGREGGSEGVQKGQCKRGPTRPPAALSLSLSLSL